MGSAFFTHNTEIEVIKLTPVTVGVASVVIAPENPKRLGFYIYNNVGNTRYVTLGATSLSASPTFIITTFSFYQWPYPNMFYTGIISAIGNAGSGTMTVYELQAKAR